MSVIVKKVLAKKDMAEIWSYIADECEERADAFIATINQKFLALVGSPNIGRLCDELETGLRSFPIGRYVVFYRTITKGIEVIRVLHSARDLASVFQSDD